MEFDLRALLFVTINDWPALSNISGQSNKGYNACTHCLGETDSIYLGNKNVYLGHRRFLPKQHVVIMGGGKHFRVEADNRTKPTRPTGDVMYDMVKDLKVIFGKGPGGQSVPNDSAGHVPMWKKMSIFWELPYWKILEVHSSIDVMHVTKNLCVNLLNFLGVYGKTKDTPDARQDQQRMHERDNLNPEKYQGPASYALTKEEKEIFFEVLSSIKVPSGFSSNIKGIINMTEKKFQNLKSHDCHVIMTQLLPIALRGLLPENVRVPIVKLCAFLNAISQKVINPLTLSNLQKDVVQCLVSFELVFPPSFFNIMTHLIVHLVEEIHILGPVFLHNMFPFERFMGVLKKYVHNRARPEGSISKGYGTEEVIEFCVDFIPDLKPIGVPESRYEGRLRGKGTLGKRAKINMDGHSFTKAHYTVLHNSSLVAPYVVEHKDILRSKYPEQGEDWIDGEHQKTFGGWLQTHLINDTTIEEQIYLLAKQPSLDPAHGELEIAALRRHGRQGEAGGIGTILVYQFKRIDNVPLGLAHLLALFVADQGMHIDGMERLFLEEFETHHHHAGDPEEDDVKTGDEHISGIVAAQFSRVLWPAQSRERPQRRREPGVEHVFVACQGNRFAVMGVRQSLSFLSRGGNKRFLVWTIPGRDLVTPPKLA